METMNTTTTNNYVDKFDYIYYTPLNETSKERYASIINYLDSLKVDDQLLSSGGLYLELAKIIRWTDPEKSHEHAFKAAAIFKNHSNDQGFHDASKLLPYDSVVKH